MRNIRMLRSPVLLRKVGRVAILYASQTGTAEGLARQIAVSAQGSGIEATVSTMNDGVSMFKGNVGLPDAVIFVCSTYGTGELPSNGTAFVDSLRQGGLLQLKTIPYAVFGLGNSLNENFNAAAKFLDKALSTMGAKALVKTQLSCELQNSGHNAAYLAWRKSLWKAIGGNETTLKRSYHVEECLATKAESVLRANVINAVVHVNTQLSSPDFTPPTRMLRFSVDCEAQKRMLGRLATFTDHIEVFPRNEQGLVSRFLKRMKLVGSNVVEVTSMVGPNTFPVSKLSVSTIFTEVVDLSAFPSCLLFEKMSLLTKDAKEKDRLEALANGIDEEGILRKGNIAFTVVDAFEAFPGVSADLAQILTIIPRVSSRLYSIASDCKNHASFDVVFAVPSRQTKSGEVHCGLASSTLSHLQPGDSFPLRFVSRQINTPQDETTCLIVAIGTGVGFARGLLQHRDNVHNSGKRVGKTLLLYSMRSLSIDCVFKEELDLMSKSGWLEVRYHPTGEGNSFVSPFSSMDSTIKEFIGGNGHVVYCGYGGSVPSQFETGLQRIGVRVDELRRTKRFTEEYYTADIDAENDFNHMNLNETLAGRVGNCEMFCFQCEQTSHGRGCTKSGVCGKNYRIAALQDLVVQSTKVLGFYAHQLRQMSQYESDDANRLIVFALFSTLTNVNFDEGRFVSIIHSIKVVTDRLRTQYTHLTGSGGAYLTPATKELPRELPDVDGLVALGKDASILEFFTKKELQDASSAVEMLVYSVKGIAAYADHCIMHGKDVSSVHAFIQRALAFLCTEDREDVEAVFAVVMEAGKINLEVMKCLHESNAILGVPEVTNVSVKPTPGKAILASGHDLAVLKALLERTEPLGINVFTHGEMLPAHSYPRLKQHKNLVGHFGGAWMRQAIEFPHFPGPILLTSNCITEPQSSYTSRIFTAGAVGWKGVPHLGDNLGEIRFASIIERANSCLGFGSESEFAYSDPIGITRPSTLTVGFGSESISKIAPQLLDEIKKGTITRVFVVGGCDGYEGGRSYFTELVMKLPKTVVVLTLGCAKYRINHLDLGTIGETSIPRLLDVGQCNDAYGAIQIAQCLAEGLNCPLSELPLSIVLSWFEQKSIAVLLSCLSLGLKPIHIGPSLPAFITPSLMQLLVETYGLQSLGDVNHDLEKMLSASGCS